MITVTAHPKKGKNHVMIEHFSSEIVAEQWKRVLIKNGWEILKK